MDDFRIAVHHISGLEAQSWKERHHNLRHQYKMGALTATNELVGKPDRRIWPVPKHMHNPVTVFTYWAKDVTNTW